MKDMTGKEDQYRGSAIRALCVITDVSIVYHYFIVINIIRIQWFKLLNVT